MCNNRSCRAAVKPLNFLPANRACRLPGPFSDLASAAFLLLLLFAACGREKPASIVLIMIDTQRADDLSPYAGNEDRTPNIARLAREGTTF